MRRVEWSDVTSKVPALLSLCDDVNALFPGRFSDTINGGTLPQSFNFIFHKGIWHIEQPEQSGICLQVPYSQGGNVIFCFVFSSKSLILSWCICLASVFRFLGKVICLFI
uniref:Uncharacterized protein n=1 Tax=Anguilla anguilla TaxID=7936 RepID=A0A0E9XDT6_ANGAN